MSSTQAQRSGRAPLAKAEQRRAPLACTGGERTPESAASPSLRSLPEKPTMAAVSRFETSLDSTSMPPRRAMATTATRDGALSG